MQQHNLSSRIRIIVADALESAIHNLISRHRQFPIIRVNAHAHHQVAKFLGLISRFHFLRLVRFGITKIGWTKEDRGPSRLRFNQTLSGIEFEIRYR